MSTPRTALAGLVTTLGIAVITPCGCGPSESPPVPYSSEPQLTSQDEALHSRITAFCGACHSVPQPDSFPRDAWYHEVDLAYRLFADSDRQDLSPPAMQDVVSWYQERAPEALTLHAVSDTPSPVLFERETIDGQNPRLKSFTAQPPGVSSFLVPASGSSDQPPSPLFCDMSRNGVFSLSIDAAGRNIRPLIESRNPARIDETDLNGDGRPDYLLSELGSYLPQDHDQGRLLWVTATESGRWESHILVDSVGRISASQAADFDGDQDLDVVVAVFGWRRTGQLLYLEQTGRHEGIPQFTTRQLDDRHGVIHVPTVDLDDDGDMDFLALFSQEHETIEAFLNDGSGRFERQVVFLAGSPAYGSSSLELADMDHDGDIDVVYANGDTLDSTLLKPDHSVQWLENRQDFPFVRHPVGWLPGASRGIPADIDSDGDLDVVASAWIPPDAEPPSTRPDHRYSTLVWYEQHAPGQFAAHTLLAESSGGCLASVVADLDADGSPEIITGRFETRLSPEQSWIDVFWNRHRTGHAAAPAR